MRIGPIGSNAFADFYRFAGVGRVHQGKVSRDDIKTDENKNMDYLERQARNAQRQDSIIDSAAQAQAVNKANFDVSL